MSELDKTIEELEAEVMAELEEADASKDPQKKSATAAQKGDKVDDKVSGAVQDTGAPVVDPEQSQAPAKKAAASAKEIGGDEQQKGEKPAEKLKKLKAMKIVEQDDADEDDDDEKPIVANKGTKAAMVKEIDDMMKKMKKEDIKKLNAELSAELNAEKDEEEEDDDEAVDEEKEPVAAEKDEDEDEDDEEKVKEKKEALEARIQEIDVTDDVAALVSDDDSLSEEFKEKASAIFEVAIKSKIRPEVERIEAEVSDQYNRELISFKEELTDKVDTYLNYVVEEWTKENELAIERGLKGEIAEDFISGLKQLFEDHYIDVPDEKYDVLEAQSEKISELEEKLNEAIQKSVDLTSSNETLVREQVVSEISEDLADTEIEKFKSLTQDVDFGSEDSFREKLNTLKESYFPKVQPSSTSDETFGDEDGSTAQDVDTTDAMKTYMSAISRNQKASA